MGFIDRFAVGFEKTFVPTYSDGMRRKRAEEDRQQATADAHERTIELEGIRQGYRSDNTRIEREYERTTPEWQLNQVKFGEYTAPGAAEGRQQAADAEVKLLGARTEETEARAADYRRRAAEAKEAAALAEMEKKAAEDRAAAESQLRGMAEGYRMGRISYERIISFVKANRLWDSPLWTDPAGGARAVLLEENTKLGKPHTPEANPHRRFYAHPMDAAEAEQQAAARAKQQEADLNKTLGRPLTEPTAADSLGIPKVSTQGLNDADVIKIDEEARRNGMSFDRARYELEEKERQRRARMQSLLGVDSFVGDAKPGIGGF